jgi:hypothetical protein
MMLCTYCDNLVEILAYRLGTVKNALKELNKRERTCT